MKQIIILLLLSFVLATKIFGQASIDKASFDTLINKAQWTNSSALVVYLDGKLYNERYFGKKEQKIEAMSSTKSIVSYAIGKLLTDGLIRSIDQYVYEFYPEWNEGLRKEITIRHLLNHTSGLQNNPNTTVEIYPSKDFIRLALDAEVLEKPGTMFRYNNKAVNLLAGIIEKASGRKLDVYLKENLFNPMGITDFNWAKDKSGNPQGMAGFQVLPEDFAKLGQLFINKGVWNDKPLINKTWFDDMIKPSELEPTCGLLWWIIYKKKTAIVDDAHIAILKRIGLPDNVLTKLATLKGTYTDSAWKTVAAKEIVNSEIWKKEYMDILQNNNIGLSRKEYDEPIGYATRGNYGNYMFVNPAKKLVVVRMITEQAYTKSNNNKSDFNDFFDLVSNL
ncbi:MAG TPA: serine hydrolase [Haliscomenobacter sp.]|uniref:serine hydrolase domain-containing protein n=1 Tax=Haliscomenobacter sp. TaxID=2717303 RepID=UPI002CF699F1|nr:serine hydrolase [Haliscomenobacter sp.]HOY20483.1 serine hydrolase [Haliscomenobacter sp.]